MDRTEHIIRLCGELGPAAGRPGLERLTGDLPDPITHYIYIIEANGGSWLIRQSKRPLSQAASAARKSHDSDS